MRKYIACLLALLASSVLLADGPGGGPGGGGTGGPGGGSTGGPGGGSGNQPDQPGGGGSSGGSSGSFTYDTFLTDSASSDGAITYTNLWTGYDTSAKTITVPKGVTAMVPGVCAGNTAINTVDLSATSITELPTAAFRGCTGLTSVTLPATCTAIGDGAFEGCTLITAIDTNVTRYGENAYYQSGVVSPELQEDFVTNAAAYASVSLPTDLTKSGIETWLKTDNNLVNYLYASVVATNADFSTALKVDGTNFVFTAQDLATLKTVGAALQVSTDLSTWSTVLETDIVDGVYTMPSATNAFARIVYTVR